MKLSGIITTTILISSSVLFFACGSEGVKKDQKPVDIQQLTKTDQPKAAAIKESDIPVTHPLNQEWVAAGQKTYELKCQPCHKLTEDKLVGPGWTGVTQRRKPEWIMNFVTNTDEMINKDPQAQALLEECLVRMPNQALSDDDARHVYEFMRKNDGVK